MRKALTALATATLVAGTALTGSADARDRDRSRVDITANQIVDQYNARTARIKADLRLTPEQEKNWDGFESAMRDIAKTNADRQIAMRDARAQEKGPLNFIEMMRREATFLSERSADRKKLADAAQPLYDSLDDQQKRRFAKELVRLGREPGGD